MNCESIREQLVDLLRDALEPDSRLEVERHLKDCDACRREHAELELVWRELDGLDAVDVPSAALRHRFYGWLSERERPAPWRRWLSGLRASPLQPAWSLATLVLGIALGASLVWAAGARTEVRRLSAEVDEMSRAVSLSLLAHQSASERLRGVSWSGRALADDRIIEALLDSVRHDPNVNVRLAALETLARQIDSPRVHAGLIESLPRQDSPVLQVSMVEILNAKNGGSAEDAIQQLLLRDDLDDQARTQIQSLRSST